jgi:hypothetical protein
MGGFPSPKYSGNHGGKDDIKLSIHVCTIEEE